MRFIAWGRITSLVKSNGILCPTLMRDWGQWVQRLCASLVQSHLPNTLLPIITHECISFMWYRVSFRRYLPCYGHLMYYTLLLIIHNLPPLGKLAEIDYSDLQFLDPLGEGGFGMVYKGMWKSRNIFVAIKKQNIINEREVCCCGKLIM